jgi:protein transport protein SEC31
MDWCPKDSGILLSGGKDNRAIVWDTNSGNPIGDLAHSANWTFDAKWCPRNPDLCAISSFDGMVTLHSLQGSSDHPEDDAFSPTPVHIEPQIVDPNDPFSQIGVQHHQQRKMSQPVFSLPHPPKWLRRPVGAVWGFGGKLAVFDTIHGTSVTIKTVPVSDEIAFRADQLDYILKENNPETSAQYCDYMANSDFMHDPKDKDFWNFLKGLFSSEGHADMSGFLNYDPSFSKEERLSKLVKKLSLSSEDEPEVNGENSPDRDQPKGVQFALYSAVNTEESDIDALVTKAVSVGDFEHAVDACLGSNRMADALVLALNGTPELLERTQRAYFKKQAGTRPYIRILKAIVDGNLTDIISNAKLDGNNAWRDLIAFISTYSKSEDFAALFSILGKRIIDPASGLKDPAIKAHAAVLCFVGSRELDQVVSLWCEPKKGRLSAKDVSLQNLAEKLSMLRQAIQYDDLELNLEHSSEGTSPLHNLYEIYVKYAWLASVQGNLDVAWRFLEHVPLNFIPAEGDITILRDRVYASRGHVLAATGQRPIFPFEFVDVVDHQEQQRQMQAQADAHAHQLSRQQSFFSQQSQPSHPVANNWQNTQHAPWQQGPPQNQWQASPQQMQPLPIQNQWQPSVPNNNWQKPLPSVAPPALQPLPSLNQWQKPVLSPPPVARSQWQPQPLPSTTSNQWTAPISTGHAAPAPSSHYQPPTNGQTFSRSNSFSAPPPTLTKNVIDTQNGR